MSTPKIAAKPESLTGPATRLPFAEIVEGVAAEALPTCRDPDDQIFLELAQAGAAEVLVTGDEALLELAGEVSFRILNPRQFREMLELR